MWLSAGEGRARNRRGEERAAMRPFVRNGLIASGTAAGYFACAVVGTVLSVPPDGFAVVWPATAFLIGVLLILPPRAWWCSAAAIPAHLLVAAVWQPDA